MAEFRPKIIYFILLFYDIKTGVSNLMIEFRPKIIHCFAATSSLSTNCLAAMRSPAVSLFPHERNPGLQRYRIQNIETAASLNCATLRSGMELRSESTNARSWPTPPHRSKYHKWARNSGPQQDANWQKTTGRTTARASPASVSPGVSTIPVGATDPVPKSDRE